MFVCVVCVHGVPVRVCVSDKILCLMFVVLISSNGTFTKSQLG